MPHVFYFYIFHTYPTFYFYRNNLTLFIFHLFPNFTGASTSSCGGSAGAADIEITVKWRNSTLVVVLASNATFDNLTSEICNYWDHLILVDFTIYANKKTIMSDAAVTLFLNGSDRVLKVETQTVGFSDINLKAVLDWAGVNEMDLSNDLFDSADIDESISGVTAIIDHAVADLKFKDAFYGPITDCLEASVREYISTILTAAAGIAKQIKLSAEREISGRKATGPLDYVMLYKKFYIVVAEAKKDQLKSGVVQNVAQMIASRETYLFNTQGRKRGYLEMAGQIAQVPSTGIVSTGEKWMLLRYILHPVPQVLKSAVYSLPISDISLAGTDSTLRSKVVALLEKIVGALNLQKEAVDANEFTKVQKM